MTNGHREVPDFGGSLASCTVLVRSGVVLCVTGHDRAKVVFPYLQPIYRQPTFIAARMIRDRLGSSNRPLRRRS
jgi:hypothetical protein